MIGVTSTLCFLVLAGTAPGGQVRDNRNSLRGLTALHVYVLAKDRNAEKDGFSLVQLQRNIERQLKNAGIKVLADDEPHADSRSAVLFVTVSTLKVDRYAFGIQIELVQQVTLLNKNSELTAAATWKTGLIGMATPSNKLPERLLQDAMDLTNDFIKDFASVNGRQASLHSSGSQSGSEAVTH